MADYWIRTCVDPVSGDKYKTRPTGYKPPPEQGQFYKPEDFTYKVGDELEINKYAAKKIADDRGFDLAFRNIKVTEVVAETHDQVQLKFEYISHIAENCHLCGRGLENEVSLACGIGPVCAKRLGFKRVTVADADIILEKLHQLVGLIGVVGPVWIKKYNVKQKLNLLRKLDEEATSA